MYFQALPSESNILQAIWLGLNDDCDLKVSQEAFRIYNYLDDINKDWNFMGHFLNVSNSKFTYFYVMYHYYNKPNTYNIVSF